MVACVLRCVCSIRSCRSVDGTSSASCTAGWSVHVARSSLTPWEDLQAWREGLKPMATVRSKLRPHPQLGTQLPASLRPVVQSLEMRALEVSERTKLLDRQTQRLHLHLNRSMHIECGIKMTYRRLSADGRLHTCREVVVAELAGLDRSKVRLEAHDLPVLRRIWRP